MMTRHFLFYLLCFTTIVAKSQQGTTLLNSSKEKYASFKNLVDVNSTVWNVGMKGINSISLFLNNGDTITYSVSRERTRNATFFVLDSSSVIVNTKFKSNTITGHYIITRPGMYLFKVKNHSFLGNKFSLDIKKKGITPKIEKVILPDTTYINIDSTVTLLDSIAYLACTLNLKQPKDFIIPYQITKNYKGFIVKSIEVSLHTQTLDSKIANKSKNKIVHTCLPRKTENISDGFYTIYLHASNLKSNFLDSLTTSAVADQICRTTFVSSRSKPQNIVLENDDKVLGKHVHIQLKEIRTRRKPVVKNVN